MIAYKVPPDFLAALESNAANIKRLLEEGKSLIEEMTGLKPSELDTRGRLLFNIENRYNTVIPTSVRYDKHYGALTVRQSSKEGKALSAAWDEMLKRIDFKYIDHFSLFKQVYFRSSWKIDTVQGVKCFVVYDGIDPEKEGWEPIEV